MTADESRRWVRTYSGIEGLQRAHTVSYSARAVPQGVLAEAVLRGADGAERRQAALCPSGSLEGVERALQFLSENSVGLSHWLEVLADLGITAVSQPPPHGKNGAFCGF